MLCLLLAKGSRLGQSTAACPLCACYEAVGQVGAIALDVAQDEGVKAAALWLGVMLKCLMQRYASSGGGLVRDISHEAECRTWGA